ncbi:unnamed protein product [Closterium sp. Naga37s-1]|nr:unnamed protein product [Closterium sp. Naga37s-1]
MFPVKRWDGLHEALPSSYLHASTPPLKPPPTFPLTPASAPPFPAHRKLENLFGGEKADRLAESIDQSKVGGKTTGGSNVVGGGVERAKNENVAAESAGGSVSETKKKKRNKGKREVEERGAEGASAPNATVKDSHDVARDVAGEQAGNALGGEGGGLVFVLDAAQGFRDGSGELAQGAKVGRGKEKKRKRRREDVGSASCAAVQSGGEGEGEAGGGGGFERGSGFGGVAHAEQDDSEQKAGLGDGEGKEKRKKERKGKGAGRGKRDGAMDGGEDTLMVEANEAAEGDGARERGEEGNEAGGDGDDGVAGAEAPLQAPSKPPAAAKEGGGGGGAVGGGGGGAVLPWMRAPVNCEGGVGNSPGRPPCHLLLPSLPHCNTRPLLLPLPSSHSFLSLSFPSSQSPFVLPPHPLLHALPPRRSAPSPPASLLRALALAGISYLFPVQATVWRELLGLPGNHPHAHGKTTPGKGKDGGTGRAGAGDGGKGGRRGGVAQAEWEGGEEREAAGLRAASHDLCVCAPTGSGKTLAYALPVVQALAGRVVRRVRAVVVLPTRDLAAQVKHVFDTIAPAVGLSVALINGQSSLADEATHLVPHPAACPGPLGLLTRSSYSISGSGCHGGSGYSSEGDGCSGADIVVATPGRLVDHRRGTQGFSLSHLQFLVVDEADRLLRQSYHHCLPLTLTLAAAAAAPCCSPLCLLPLPTFPRAPPGGGRGGPAAAPVVPPLPAARPVHTVPPLSSLPTHASLPVPPACTPSCTHQVVDEADRLLRQSYHDWLPLTLAAPSAATSAVAGTHADVAVSTPGLSVAMHALSGALPTPFIHGLRSLVLSHPHLSTFASGAAFFLPCLLHCITPCAPSLLSVPGIERHRVIQLVLSPVLTCGPSPPVSPLFLIQPVCHCSVPCAPSLLSVPDIERHRVIKLVCSATLTRDPSKIQRLRLHRPLFISSAAHLLASAMLRHVAAGGTRHAGTTADVEGGDVGVEEEGMEEGREEEAEEAEEEGVRHYHLPPQLVTSMLVCPRASDKPLLLAALLKHLTAGAGAGAGEGAGEGVQEGRRDASAGATAGANIAAAGAAAARPMQLTLVFASSLQAAHRLFLLLSAFPPASLPFVFAEFSSRQPQRQRSAILDRFRKGEVQVLVASDAMTRGMDVEGVFNVVSYDAPVYPKTFVHRAGRTARAGRPGHCYTILRKQEVRNFKVVLGRWAVLIVVRHFKAVLGKVGCTDCPQGKAPSPLMEGLREHYDADECCAVLVGAVRCGWWWCTELVSGCVVATQFLVASLERLKAVVGEEERRGK